MNTNKTEFYENYPPLFVIFSNLVGLSIYLLGAIILSGFGWLAVTSYLLYCAALEIRLFKKSCVDCYYYGKLCFSGRGLICSLLFKKGDPKRFISKKVSWSQLIPDLLVPLIPLIGGIILSITNFNWLRIALMLLLSILGFPVIGYIRSSLACLHCKQRELGCPAVELFGGKQDKS
jgi:hypothetical protein